MKKIFLIIILVFLMIGCAEKSKKESNTEISIKTNDDKRTLPTDRTNEELQQLRRQINQLQQQVDLLSQEDQEYEEQVGDGDEIVIYCEDINACQNCIRQGLNKFATHRAYFEYLQKYYLKKSSDLNDWIEWGNSMSSLPGGQSMAWGPIYMKVVKPAIDNLKDVYSNRFDEYIKSMESDLNEVRGCYTGINDDVMIRGGYEAQMFIVINALKASKIQK